LHINTVRALQLKNDKITIWYTVQSIRTQFYIPIQW